MVVHKRYLVVLFAIVMLPSMVKAQFEGIWGVTEVKVGNEQLTPVSKWFQFKADNQILSGNGGMMNTRGAWQFDESEQTLLFFDEAGEEDEYGPFKIEIGGGTMTWNREEDGMNVTVFLEQVDQVPVAPWDNVLGSWTKTEQTGQDLTLGEIGTILLRWDRVFAITEVGNNEKHFGVWHMNSHRPELKLLSGKGDAFDTSWIIEFDQEGNMIWQSKDTTLGIEILFTKN